MARNLYGGFVWRFLVWILYERFLVRILYVQILVGEDN